MTILLWLGFKERSTTSTSFGKMPMSFIGILPNDVLVVDRSLKPNHNKIVIAAIDGELTVKRLYHRSGVIKLLPENSAYPEISFESETDLTIWGVVVGSFRRFQAF